MRRRQFLILSAASIGGVLVYSLDRQASRVFAQEKSTQTLKIPLRFFTEEEALIVAAAASRIFPSDDSGPGAKEAGVVIFIDRQLAGPWGRDRYRYAQGPFDENAAREFGYQGKATPRETYREGLKGLKGFDRLSPAEQDKKLTEIESTHLFALLRQNTIEGMFSDPVHGGNVDMVGWQLVGFPGPRMSNYDEVDKHFGEAFRPKPVSLEQVLRRKVHPSEDEGQGSAWSPAEKDAK
jgi:gluconate 2-dehydrogenase gamma chain